MLNAILIENTINSEHSFRNALSLFAPKIQIVKHTKVFQEALNYLDQTDVIFYDLSLRDSENSTALFDQKDKPQKLVGIGKTKADAYRAYKIKADDFILTPCAQSDLKGVINRLDKKSSDQNTYEELIGIPTIDGYEFFSTEEIIRCEGYQNCTRIITDKRPDIISSYNIGVFRKKLEEHSFFSPHKSHLINIKHIRKYHKEGSLQLSDESVVPVSKRRKPVFLKMMSLSR